MVEESCTSLATRCVSCPDSSTWYLGTLQITTVSFDGPGRRPRVRSVCGLLDWKVAWWY